MVTVRPKTLAYSDFIGKPNIVKKIITKVLGKYTPKQLAAKNNKAAILGATTGDKAIAAGKKILLSGGNALDAVIASAVNQIVESGGSWNSFAGVSHIIYYDAKTKSVHGFDGGFNTPLAHSPASSIPEKGAGTALVPGFWRGVELAHRQFGKLSLGDLIKDASKLAKEGFEIPKILASSIKSKYDNLKNTDWAKIFTKDSKPLDEGDILVQPELAETLDQIIRFGPDYIYERDWAKCFVDRVNRDNANTMSLDDLKQYKAKE